MQHISRQNWNFRFYSRERKFRSRRLRSGAFYDYHTVLDFGGQTEKRVLSEIGLHFFICQTGHIAVEDITESPCRNFLNAALSIDLYSYKQGKNFTYVYRRNKLLKNSTLNL